MAWDYQELEFSILGGQNTLDNPADIWQVPRNVSIGTLDPATPTRMVQAQDVYALGDRYDLTTRPGFTNVRATAINAAGIFTGMGHQGEIADRFLLTVSIAAVSHNIYQDDADPPTAIAGGTNLAIGQDNLTTLLNFTDGTNQGTIILSRQRNLPQFINSSGVRSNLTIAGTGLTSLLPALGEVFGQRAIYADYDQDGTVRLNRVAWSDLRDGNLITDITAQFESFERRTADKVRCLKQFSDYCLVGSRDYLAFLVITPAASKPFAIQDVPLGSSQGPLSHQGIITTAQRAIWLAQNGVFGIEGSRGEVVKEWTKPIKPYMNTLDEDRREFCVAGYDPETNIACFAVSEDGQAAHNKVIGINLQTSENYIWTLTRNAFANRIVSGEQRLVGGGLVGRFYNEIQTAVFTGNADDATAAIDADVITPRHHCGQPSLVKLFAGVKVTFDPQGTSEAVTVQYRLNDSTTWVSFAASPYSVTGTDVKMKFFPLMKTGTHLQLRFRDANSGQAFRITKYVIVFKVFAPGLVVPTG